MLPSIATLESFGIDRDGTALSALFRDADGMQVELVFPVRRDATRAQGYHEPELHRHVPHVYTSRFDGDNLAYTTREDTPLTWEQAHRLLELLAPHVGPAVPGATRWLPEMRHAAASRGGTLHP